uniref:Uncharacterized protein n=1 Tax=Cannabis sativa TaxID=3483 RepID=A0A803PJY0_CANSA
MSFRKGTKSGLYLIFPNLIYKILSGQGKLILENKSIEPPSFGPTFKVLKKPPQGKTSRKKARSTSLGALYDTSAASASTSTPTKLAEIKVHLGRIETCQGVLLRRINRIIKYFHVEEND